MERKNAWKGYDEAKSAKVDALAKDYMDFLDNGKTERECVDTIVNQIEAAGYRELPELMKEAFCRRQGICGMDEQDGCDVPDRNKADDRRLKHSGCTYRFPQTGH